MTTDQHVGEAVHLMPRDIMAVSALLGHASVATTQGYVGVPDASMRAAVAAAALGRAIAA